MTPNYRKFIVAALRAESTRFSANDILANAFMMWDEDDCNEAVQGALDCFNPDVIVECFHKQFRQIDMTHDGYLDSIIWHAMHERTNMHKIVRYIADHKTKFTTHSIGRIVDDYEWDD